MTAAASTDRLIHAMALHGLVDAASEAGLAVVANRKGARAAFVVSVLPPGAEQSWSEGDPYSSGRIAVEDARNPQPRLPTGAVVRVSQGRRATWFGVSDRNRDVIDAPPLPVGLTNGAKGWDEAWNGSWSSPSWMLDQCRGVKPQRLVRAAVSCARLALPVFPDEESAAREAVEAAEAWSEGDMDLRDFIKACDALEPIARRYTILAEEVDRGRWSPSWQSQVARAAHSFMSLSMAADRRYSDTARVQAAGRAATASAVASSETLASLIRREIPLGVVLLSLLGQPV